MLSPVSFLVQGLDTTVIRLGASTATLWVSHAAVISIVLVCGLWGSRQARTTQC